MEFKDFNIEVYGLSNKLHQFEFSVDDSFFAKFENSLIHHGKAGILVDLNKTETFIEMKFNINGSYELTCDRSLRPFEQDFTCAEKVLFKYGEEEKALDDDIFIITKGTQRLNIAQFIYEFISITVPMKKIHPDYEEDLTDDDIEGEIIFTTNDEENEKDSNLDQDDIDPRWNALKNLNKKN